MKRAVPGSVTAHEDGLDMPTLTVKPEQLVEVATHLRDELWQELPVGRERGRPPRLRRGGGRLLRHRARPRRELDPEAGARP